LKKLKILQLCNLENEKFWILTEVKFW
jgi:hypothetical protein